MSPMDVVAFFEKVTQETGHPAIVVWGPPVFTAKALWLPEEIKLSAPSFVELGVLAVKEHAALVKAGRIPGTAYQEPRPYGGDLGMNVYGKRETPK